MKKTTTPQRPSADITRQRILQAALKLFIQHGFAGTSTSKLAELADVNQSLIFHHFGDKQHLWQQVKENLVTDIDVEPVNATPETLAEFLAEAVQQRISIYTKRPELARLISWQRLEPAKRAHQLKAIPGNPISPHQWLEPIKYLQKQGKLMKEWTPECVLAWIVTSVNGLIMDDYKIFDDHPKNRENYINMIVGGLTKALG